MLARPLGRGDLARTVLAYVVGGGAVLVAALAVAVDRFGVVDHAGPADVIVVLGARVEPDGRPSSTLAVRVAHGVSLWKEGLAPVLLFSGGLGDGGRAEALAARDYAVSLGVPATATLVEDASHNTAQNARFSARILRERGMQRVLVTTDPYHCLRARQLFRREHFEVATSPVLEAERHHSLPSRLMWTLREVAALLRSPDLLVRGPLARPDGGPSTRE